MEIFSQRRRALALLALGLAMLPSCAPARAEPAARARVEPASAPPAAATQGEVGQEMDRYLSRLVPFGFSGNVLVVSGSGQTILASGYGLADRARNQPFTAHTAVPIGSITKAFTHAGILALEAEGKLSTGDSLATFFPDIPRDKAGITLDQVLAMSAGFPFGLGGDDERLTREEFLQRVFSAPLTYPPGTRREYSNVGYGVLAAVIERVAGRDYEEFLRERIFLPAGMQHTGWRYPDWSGLQIARTQRGGDLDLPDVGDGLSWSIRGAGGFYSTPEDMHRFHRALLAGRLLPPAALAKFPYASGPQNPMGVAGGDGFFQTVMLWDRGDSTFVFASTNTQAISAQTVSRPLLALARGEKDQVREPPATIALPEREIERFAGTYRLPGGGELTASTGEGFLRVRPEGQEAMDLIMGADPATRAERERYAARTDSIVRASFRGDFEPLRRALDSAESPEEFARGMRTMRAQQEQRYGPFQGHRILGTRARPGSPPMVFVSYDYERGSVVAGYGWSGNTIVLFGMGTDPTERMLPTSPTEFVSFHPGRPSTPRLRFEQEQGRWKLLVETPQGMHEAVRVT